jgi:transcriptional regulator with XRE-family HTH domain
MTVQMNPDHIRYATVDQLALLMGTSRQRISNWANGKSAPSGRLLNRAFERTGVPKTIFLKGLDLRKADTEKVSTARIDVQDLIIQLNLEQEAA